MTKYCISFSEIRHTDLASVGGKNASLGEMIRKMTPLGIRVPMGFAVTVAAFRAFLREAELEAPLKNSLDSLDKDTLSNLPEVGRKCRRMILSTAIPDQIQAEIQAFYLKLGKNKSVAVRSSATAEDLPSASFAGQHDSFLNIKGPKALLEAVRNCYASLYNDRAIKYRLDNGFDHMDVGLSVGVQHMVRSDKGSAGVAFTLDPESGFDNVVYLTSAWGLGEMVVQGAVNPDEFYLFKPSLAKALSYPILQKKPGAKEHKMVFAKDGKKPLKIVPTTAGEKTGFSLEESDLIQLGKWCLEIEKLYDTPMDIEWAKDGKSGELSIVQARPETVHRKKALTLKTYHMPNKPDPLCVGKAVGKAIASGKVVIVNSLSDASKVEKGDIIVADITNPDWNALLRKAICIVTNKGGRTSHASIVARELGIHAVVGCGNATEKLKDGQVVTVSCAEGDEGEVFDGKLDWEEREVHLGDLKETKTRAMLILADPDRAFQMAMYPQQGVGLLRMEFIISTAIRIHPMALVRYGEMVESHEKRAIHALTSAYENKELYFVEKLAASVGMVAAAFYPKEVIVRMSDFKSNEYRELIGGKYFEPEEENPMLGFRGASRYYHGLYREGFGLECRAMKRVREEMGLDNVKLMVPFCRTPEEGKQVLKCMKSFGLERGKKNLEIYMMVEIPSNVILAETFADLFDGFSIGSNDLTQLILGVDRDSELVSGLFDENNPAVKEMLARVIRDVKRKGKMIGLCGQAPSDYPEFAGFLVDQGIDSISFNADALIGGIKNIQKAENK
ncbi:phosphoenolpyruvate synthase [Cyclobacterium sp.]|uniref:phosphoenolpyruvate synthase n=1 Tax=Cyclobacterium sp. TaxID=1966343 RepID=UPI00198E6354|nr:phosphoenolpyruvate synthase [Cyclobacterium sp.]MBD3627723.1 phosphoenolpyruvate synthase [Cyclobacterium sp.]